MTTEPPRELTVPFMGRELAVTLPSPEQMLVWQRIVTRLQEAPMNASWTGVEVMRALERLRLIFDSLLTSPADVEWLDDQFLKKTVDFRSLTDLLTQVIDKFAEAGDMGSNREEKRAAKKAARKKVTTPR